ncbi:MAG: class I SAM-dependent methyltransferase [Alcanivoracaceae bacterium]|nr:class I SAM-dependent methyltransferase [Alcanivoracaceae bacterium]
MACPLCTSTSTDAFFADAWRRYHHCARCDLVFVDPAQLPPASEEKAQYDLHENDPDDPGYRRFLSRLATPLLQRLAPQSSGLDYGCGPGPALARMLEEAGHRVALYDPLYQPGKDVLESRYDFVTCTEVVEHFHQPARDWQQLVSLLRPGGWLAVMTCWREAGADFGGWHYRRDPTHVSFYSMATLEWLAHHYRLALDCPDRNVALFRQAP